VTARPATCPSCGAGIAFLWSAAVQTTCPYCRSILVRHDVDLEKVGIVGDLPPDASPIQRGTEGRWKGQSFLVVGRIIYEHERGSWNEWHLRFGDGTSGWLSDAQLEYAVSTLAEHEAPFRDPDQLHLGEAVRHGDERFLVTTMTVARYRGVEGELPFEYWDKRDVTFVDLENERGSFATIDYSESPPLFFVGAYATFAELALRNVRTFDGWPVPG
jgi:hypothetical protein